MLPPADYPQRQDKNPQQQSDITYGALLDMAMAEKPITEEMIRRACIKMETAQQFPFAEKPTETMKPIKRLLGKLHQFKR